MSEDKKAIDDLMSMLDLGGKDAAPSGAGGGALIAAGRAAPPVNASPTAIKVDLWGMDAGEQIIAQTTNPINKMLLSGVKLGTGLLNKQDRIAAAADLYATAFERFPEMNEACTEPARHKFLKALLESSDYRSLHTQTMWDAAASELATLHFAKSYMQYKATTKDGNDGAGGIGGDIQAEAAAQAASNEASKEVEDLQNMRTAMGGMGIGGPAIGGKVDTSKMLDIYRQMRGTRWVKQIMQWAGRFRILAQGKQRQKVSAGEDDMVGVTMADEISKLLPVELAMLADDILELDVMRRIVECRALCRDVRQITKVGAGPIIVLVDESGSMQSFIAKAKGLALAMAYLARRQRRWCALCGWSDHHSQRTIALPPGQWDEKALFNWLENFFGGDTYVPLEAMPSIYDATKAPPGKTDIILITDGSLALHPRAIKNFNEWKKKVQAKMYTLSLKCDINPCLTAVSDEAYKIADIDTDVEAVGRVLSI